MARIFTTPESEIAAKVLMHNITVAGGINTKNLRTGDQWPINDGRFIKESQVICNELVNRNFTDIDSSIKSVSQYRFRPNYDDYGKYKALKPEAVAKAIVYLAECLGLYWDDTIRTPYEVAEFQKTLLGSAVYRFGRCISAIQDPTTKKAKATTGTTGTTASAPQNGYKSSGPQSGNVRDLQGTPGDKVYANTNLIFKIIADKVGKNTPNVFIKPLSASGATGSTNKIFISSGNGYTDCTCYFDELADAQDFLDKIIKAGRVPSNIQNLRIVKMTADKNGYFLVGTEFGTVAVSAKTLNEALTEAAKEVNEELTGWEKATKNYTKEELNELHTWMRRD